MDRDLFLSILALDSYNHGYNAGTKMTETQIGLATTTLDTDNQAARNIGFYAIAYDWNGEKVISYRGTDNYSLSNDIGTSGTGASDITSGWSVSLGVLPGTQAGTAIDFYKSVTNRTSEFDRAPANVVLTGHSLGGGLAGFVAALSA
jgi:Lipase (class 3)